MRVDSGLDLLYANASASDLFELPQSAVGRPLVDSVAAFAPLIPLLSSQVAAGEIRTYRELELAVGGRTVTLDCIASPLPPAELILELYPLDRHLLISREDALTQRYQAGRALLLQLAHEIRNPLGGVRGAAQLLEAELEDPSLRDYTRIILREVDRLGGLVETLLGPLTPPRCSPFNIHEPAEHVLNMLETERVSSLRLIRDYDPSLPELFLDRDLLVQALLNLVRNAREAMRDTGTIRIRTRIERQYTIQGRRHPLAIRLDVEDEGPGVPPELGERLFLPLVSGRPGGTGLGLAIAQDLVQRQGGLIEWQSRPGRTVFSVLLPLGSSP
jgi:two-component system nitrogen regulation sensor histidine kinase GlnL